MKFTEIQSTLPQNNKHTTQYVQINQQINHQIATGDGGPGVEAVDR